MSLGRQGWLGHRGLCLPGWVDVLSGVNGVSEGTWGSGSSSWWCELAHRVLGVTRLKRQGDKDPKAPLRSLTSGSAQTKPAFGEIL